MHASTPTNPTQRGRLHLHSLRPSFSRSSLRSLFSISTTSAPRSTSISEEPVSPTNTDAPRLPSTTTVVPQQACAFSPPQSSARTFSASSHRSYRSVSPSRSFSSSASSDRNCSVFSQQNLRMRWELEEELMEERRLFGGKQIDLLEPRPSVAESMEGGLVGLGMGGMDAMVVDASL